MENWTAQLTRSNAQDIAALLRKYLSGKLIRPIIVWDDHEDFEPAVKNVTRLVEGRNKIEVIDEEGRRVTILLIYLEGEEPEIFSTDLRNSDESDENHLAPVFSFQNGVVTIIYRKAGNYARHLFIPVGTIPVKKPAPATRKPAEKTA